MKPSTATTAPSIAHAFKTSGPSMDKKLIRFGLPAANDAPEAPAPVRVAVFDAEINLSSVCRVSCSLKLTVVPFQKYQSGFFGCRQRLCHRETGSIKTRAHRRSRFA